jgi:hypothetical protein
LAKLPQNGLTSWKNKLEKHNSSTPPFFLEQAATLVTECKQVEPPDAKEIENLVKCLRAYGEETVQYLLAALLLWLFGNLVFIPLANSLNWQTKGFVSLIFFVPFTILVAKTIPGLKKLVEAFSPFPARKYGSKKGLTYTDSIVLFRYAFYIILTVVFYLLYHSFLTNFHPSISGMVLILVLVWIFFLSLRILSILFPRFLEWLVQA